MFCFAFALLWAEDVSVRALALCKAMPDIARRGRDDDAPVMSLFGHERSNGSADPRSVSNTWPLRVTTVLPGFFLASSLRYIVDFFFARQKKTPSTPRCQSLWLSWNYIFTFFYCQAMEFVDGSAVMSLWFHSETGDCFESVRLTFHRWAHPVKTGSRRFDSKIDCRMLRRERSETRLTLIVFYVAVLVLNGDNVYAHTKRPSLKRVWPSFDSWYLGFIQ